VFDPDRSGVGHQPQGFDQLAVLYNRYRVISTSYAINTTAAVPIRVCAIPTNESPGVLSLSDVVERPRAKFVVQNPGGDTKTLKGKCYIPSLVGRTKSQYMADDRYQSTVTGSPAELALLNIFAKDLADSTVEVQGTIVMEFLVEFFDANQLSQS